MPECFRKTRLDFGGPLFSEEQSVYGLEAVPVLFVEAANEADERLLIIDWRAGGIGVQPVAEFLMERLIIPAGIFGAQGCQRRICEFPGTGFGGKPGQGPADHVAGIDEGLFAGGSGGRR